MKQHLGTITIMSTDRYKNSSKIQKILTANSKLIINRLGLNVQPQCLRNCTGLIVLVVRGTRPEIKKLSQEINDLYAVIAKFTIITN